VPFEVLVKAIDSVLMLYAYQHAVGREVGKHKRIKERQARVL
jgi:hypothetical protein